MKSTTKKLRPYQVRLVTDVCRATGDVLVEQPTGSGKTVQIVTLVAMHLGHRFTHAVISAPQEQIEQGFVKRDYQTIAFPDCEGVAHPAFAVPEKLILGARRSGLGSVKQIAAYLRQSGPLDYALACTHAALNQLTPERLPSNLAGKALFIDEAHHASADGLSRIVALWRERGGQLFFFTATPYRGDGRPVRLDPMRVFRRSLAEHMAEGFAPRHLESEIVALGQPGDAITAGQFTGEEAPPSSYFDGLVAAICRRWVEDGKPKAIVRVPPMRGGRSGTLVSRLKQALSSQGARVLDATGTGTADKQRFLSGLDAEKSRTYATSAFDVMVGIQRVVEGTDWPVCSAVYCVGLPGSLNPVVQFLGRAMRLKGEDYPAAQRDRARLAFFVPCAGGAALTQLSLDHSRHVLLTCCFLADHEVGQEWIVLREVRRGIEAALGSRTENPAAADAENDADEPIDRDVRTAVESEMATAREEIINSGGEPTVGELVRWTAEIRPDLPEASLNRIATEILAAQPDETGEAARKRLREEVAKRLRIDPRVKKAMEEAFTVVLDEFRDVTLKDSVVLESVSRQVHGITGGQMQEFTQRLHDAMPKPLTEEQILLWVDVHHERTGEWPKVLSGPILDAPGETWAGIDHALMRGNRSLPGNSSLARLLEEKRGVRNKQNLPHLSEEIILIWADAHKDKTGESPNRSAGPVHGAPGENWNAIDACLSQGIRTLPGGSSLAQLLAEHRGTRNLQDLPPLTEDQILAWMDAYHERSGRWPRQNSGPVQEAPGETWKAINLALFRGSRGFSGGSSLAKLLAEHRGIRNPQNLPALAIEQILAWADAYYESRGEWPTRRSGPVEGVPGETWNAIDVALANGARGFPGGSSLPKLLAEHRKVRNRKGLPALSIAQILVWADEHHQRTGHWPTIKSGAVCGAPGETWAKLSGYLDVGSRQLPGGSSLAKLLEVHRGVRNKQNLPDLSIDQVLEWADLDHKRTGKWPKAKSGPVDGVPGETWSGVEQALYKGSRGFPGGSSLAKLLAEYRGVRNPQDQSPLAVEQIQKWVVAHHKGTGKWPNAKSGIVHGVSGETWGRIDAALRVGLRKLPGGSSLARLLKEFRMRR